MSENPDHEDLVHCIYTSVEAERFDEEAILELLEKARKKNAGLGVTGMLLYDAGSFFQVLEGDRRVVEALFEVIVKDKRHGGITKIIVEPIAQRDFAEWTMGFSGITRADLMRIDGLNDFFHAKKCFTDLDEGRAKKLLAAFREGQWRITLR